MGFSSPSGEAAPLGHLWLPFGKPLPSAAIKEDSGALNGLKKLYSCHEDSEYVLDFEIGQRESGFYSERTESQTDVPSSTLLVYRFTFIGASFARIL